MAVDPQLVERVEKLVKRRKNIESKRMFGGVCYLDRGNMAFGLMGSGGKAGTKVVGGLMVRVAKDNHVALAKKPGVEAMKFTGKVMLGFLAVKAEAIKTDAKLKWWIEQGLAFSKTLPAKAPGKKKTKKTKKKPGQ